MEPRLLGAILATLTGAWIATGWAAEATDEPDNSAFFRVFPADEPDVNANEQAPKNGARLVAGDSAQRHWESIQKQLQDPQKRKRMWSERRAAIVETHPELAESLELDVETERRLLDLLTDHEIEQLALSIGGSDALLARADFETRRMDSLRELLGDERLERYRQYSETRYERQQIARLNAKLAPADKLSADQKSALLPIFTEQMRRQLLTDTQVSGGGPFGGGASVDDLRASFELHAIRMNEASLRRSIASHRVALEQAREHLTDVQHAALAEMYRDEEQTQRRWIERQRVQAGLPAEIPEQEEPPPAPSRSPVVANLDLEISITVNRDPARTTRVNVANGSPFMIEGGDGLWIEATPTLYDDHWLVVAVDYFEEDSDGEKRLIHKGGSFSSLTRHLDGSRGGVGGGGTVIAGRKGYAVEVFVRML